MADQQALNEINSQLILIFNEILTIEEKALKNSQFSDLTISEMHTIEAIGLSGENNSSDIAKKLDVTLGTVSVSVKKLVKKGYVAQERDPGDRRVYLLKLTKKGRQLYRIHRKLHMDMVKYTISDFDQEEVSVLRAGLKNLCEFLEQAKKNLAKKGDLDE